MSFNSAYLTNLLSMFYYGRVCNIRVGKGWGYFKQDMGEDHIGLVLTCDITHDTGTDSEFVIGSVGTVAYYLYCKIPAANDSGEYNIFGQLGCYLPIILTPDNLYYVTGGNVHGDLWFLDLDRSRDFKDLLPKAPSKGFWDLFK